MKYINQLRSVFFLVILGLSLAITSNSYARSEASKNNEEHKVHVHHGVSIEPDAFSTDSIYNLKSKWTNQDGKTVDLSILKGNPVIAALVYTSCKAACPLTVEDMKRIERDIEKSNSKVTFALFSFDPKRDTPEKLKQFAKAHNLNMQHWVLLNGAPASVQELAAVFGVRYKQNAQGEFDHSNVITLLDSEGVVRHQQVGLTQSPETLEQKLMELTKK